jgi:hypothetical protein
VFAKTEAPSRARLPGIPRVTKRALNSTSPRAPGFVSSRSYDGYSRWLGPNDCLSLFALGKKILLRDITDLSLPAPGSAAFRRTRADAYYNAQPVDGFGQPFARSILIETRTWFGEPREESSAPRFRSSALRALKAVRSSTSPSLDGGFARHIIRSARLLGRDPGDATRVCFALAHLADGSIGFVPGPGRRNRPRIWPVSPLLCRLGRQSGVGSLSHHR